MLRVSTLSAWASEPLEESSPFLSVSKSIPRTRQGRRRPGTQREKFSRRAVSDDILSSGDQAEVFRVTLQPLGFKPQEPSHSIQVSSLAPPGSDSGNVESEASFRRLNETLRQPGLKTTSRLKRRTPYRWGDSESNLDRVEKFLEKLQLPEESRSPEGLVEIGVGTSSLPPTPSADIEGPIASPNNPEAPNLDSQSPAHQSSEPALQTTPISTPRVHVRRRSRRDPKLNKAVPIKTLLMYVDPEQSGDVQLPGDEPEELEVGFTTKGARSDAEKWESAVGTSFQGHSGFGSFLDAKARTYVTSQMAQLTHLYGVESPQFQGSPQPREDVQGPVDELLRTRTLAPWEMTHTETYVTLAEQDAALDTTLELEPGGGDGEAGEAGEAGHGPGHEDLAESSRIDSVVLEAASSLRRSRDGHNRISKLYQRHWALNPLQASRRSTTGEKPGRPMHGNSLQDPSKRPEPPHDDAPQFIIKPALQPSEEQAGLSQGPHLAGEHGEDVGCGQTERTSTDLEPVSTDPKTTPGRSGSQSESRELESENTIDRHSDDNASATSNANNAGSVSGSNPHSHRDSADSRSQGEPETGESQAPAEHSQHDDRDHVERAGDGEMVGDVEDDTSRLGGPPHEIDDPYDRHGLAGRSHDEGSAFITSVPFTDPHAPVSASATPPSGSARTQPGSALANWPGGLGHRHSGGPASDPTLARAPWPRQGSSVPPGSVRSHGRRQESLFSLSGAWAANQSSSGPRTRSRQGRATMEGTQMKHFLDATYGSPARGTFQLLGTNPPSLSLFNTMIPPSMFVALENRDMDLEALPVTRRVRRPAGNSSRTLEQNARGRREATLRERHSGSSYQQLMAYNRDKLTEHHMPGGRSLHSLGGAAGYRTKGGAVLSPSLMEGGGVLEAQRLEREAAVANDAYWNSALLLTPALAAKFGEELASAKKMLAAGLAGGDRSLDKADKALAIGVGKLREPLAMKHTGPDSILVEGPFNASAPVKPWSAALPG